MSDNRFFPKFKLELGQLGEATGLAAAAARVASVVPIDRNFYEADVKVIQIYGLEGNSFEVTVAGLSPAIYDAIEAGRTTIKISLGYYTGLESQVLEGVVKKKEAKAGDCFYETTLSGVEKAFHLLETTCLRDGDVPYAENRDIRDILDAVSQRTDVALQTVAITPSPRTRLPRRWSFEQQSALDALKQVETRLRQIGGYSLSIRDGQIRYGQALGPLNNAGEVSPTEYSFDNFLAKATPVNEDRGRLCNPCEEEDETPPLGYDFEMLGDPRLRPGDTVAFRLKINGVERIEPLAIESITHDFSRARGYRCTGRALKAEKFLETVFRARAASPTRVREELNHRRDRDQERYPAVHVGDITDYRTGEHLVSARLGLEPDPNMTSPSVQVPSGAEGFTLQRRPLVSPFAWNLCGLVVPVYPGMRAVAVHNRYLREDALISGFIWTEEMTPPPNQAGDYWLSLPLNVPSNRPPNNSDKAANDLTTGDGKRVIQLKGLRITVGDGLLPNLGTRPSNVGADDELQIEHSSGAKITMKANEIKLEAGGRTLTLASGKVSVT